jgi:O-antigen/teichoic acid export membrane protein
MIIGNRESFKTSSIKLLKQSWPYFVLVLLNLPYNYLTNNFLDINSSKTQIGYFNLSQKLMSPVSLVITFSLSALFPNLSNLWMSDQEKFKNAINTGVRLFFLVALTMCFVYTSFAEFIIKLFFSAKYFSIISISQMQIWFVFLMGINSFIGTIWGATNNERMLVKSSIINAVISLPMLYYGSKFGALGLSYGYVVSFAIFEVYLWIDFKKSINLKIKQDLLLWAMVALLFVMSYFLIKKLSFLIRLVVCLITISVNIFLLLKKSKANTVIN